MKSRAKRIGTLVAERELTLLTARGKTQVVLRVGLPLLETPRRGYPFWRCPLQFDGLGPAGKVYSICGQDSLQALVLAVDFARRELNRQAKQVGGVISASGDLDIINPTSAFTEFLGTAWDECLQMLRRAEKRLRASPTAGLSRLHKEMRALVDKYPEK